MITMMIKVVVLIRMITMIKIIILSKVVCPQSLVHNERTRATFNYKTQQTFRTLIEEKRTGQVTKANK